MNDNELREVRELLGLSQDQLARELGILRGKVAHIEQGRNRAPFDYQEALTLLWLTGTAHPPAFQEPLIFPEPLAFPESRDFR